METEEVKDFQNLAAWQKGHAMVLEIYRLTQKFPKEELFGVVSQLRRAATSVTANIAEGFGRYHFKEKTRFYYQVRGSAAEVQNFLLIARDLGYVDQTVCETLVEEARQVRMLINGLIRSIDNQTTNNS